MTRWRQWRYRHLDFERGGTKLVVARAGPRTSDVSVLTLPGGAQLYQHSGPRHFLPFMGRLQLEARHSHRLLGCTVTA